MYESDSYFSPDFRMLASLSQGELVVSYVISIHPRLIEAFLSEDSTNMVVLHGSIDSVFGTVTFTPKLWVMRGGLDQICFWGEIPATSPNDAEGPVTAAEALRAATAQYYDE